MHIFDSHIYFYMCTVLLCVTVSIVICMYASQYKYKQFRAFFEIIFQQLYFYLSF